MVMGRLFIVLLHKQKHNRMAANQARFWAALIGRPVRDVDWTTSVPVLERRWWWLLFLGLTGKVWNLQEHNDSFRSTILSSLTNKISVSLWRIGSLLKVEFATSYCQFNLTPGYNQAIQYWVTLIKLDLSHLHIKIHLIFHKIIYLALTSFWVQ